MHVLTVGQTGSGKTVLNSKFLAPAYARKGYGVLVLDKYGEEWGQSEFPKRVLVTGNPDQLIAWANESLRCAIFVDEAAEVCGLGKIHADFERLATQGRHRGHRCHFIAQGMTQINPRIRSQCPYQYVFSLTPAESYKLMREIGTPEFDHASRLPRGQFFYRAPFEPARRFRLW